MRRSAGNSHGTRVFTDQMASRTKQKEQLRARRLAEERARAEQARRQRRLRMLGGVVVLAAAVVAVAIAISAAEAALRQGPKAPPQSRQLPAWTACWRASPSPATRLVPRAQR